ncbi:MAG: sigma-70 family RNA polymerase sigma factor [Rhodospirillales bacterium]|nr:sigma-70 family RNA polymerase sigma factor [Rhodospirillales bacterium]MCB9994948.1 sigma-70 family RNA polymerase sigma factor [Rhodospirillales bacterium]
MKAEKALSIEDASDEDLMADIAGGDREAFRVLAERYMNLFYSVAFRMYPQRADAEDVVQEALLRLWSKAHLWKAGTGAAVSTWLYRLTYNLCVDQKRRNKHTVTDLDDDYVDPDAAADQRIQDKQTGAIVGKALQNLPERQRVALVLCHYQGLSNAEAADIMGTSVKGVEGLLVRARKALQAELKQYKGVL